MIFKLLILISTLIIITNQVKLETNFSIQPQQPQCTRITYGHEGSACVPGEAPTNTKRCKRTLACVNGICKNGFYGVTCVNNAECWGNTNDDEGVRCINGKCMKEKYNGQKCEHSTECFSGFCIDKICYGKPKTLTCDPTKPVECEKGSYCSTTTNSCLPQKKVGDPCNDVVLSEKAGSNWRVACPGGSQCFGEVGSRNCRPFRIQKIGETCLNNIECSVGTSCVNNKCVDSQLSQDRNQHICPGYHRNCTRLERCICENENENKGKCIPSANGNLNCGLTHWGPKWLECQREHGCAHEPNIIEAILYDSLAKDTCMNDHCADVAHEWLCCLYGGHHYNEYSPLMDLPMVTRCGHNPATVVFLVLFFMFLIGLVVAGGVGAGVFLFVYKKRGNPFGGSSRVDEVLYDE